MINSQTAKLLRRWIVAGLAAALALAWTITTLVAPSQASTDQTYNISDTFQGTSSQQPVSLNMGDGWNDTGAVINFSYRQNTGQWTNYQRYAAENGRTQQFQEALDRNFEDNMEALGTAGRYFHIQSYPAAAHGAIIGGVFCADPEVTTVDYYHLGSSKDLRDKANKLEMTLDPAQAIANTGSRAYRTGFNMTDDQKKQMQILAYLYQGGDPRLEYVKADKSVAAQEFIKQNQSAFDAYDKAMAQFAGKTTAQKNAMAQVIAWYITKGEWWAINDSRINQAAGAAYYAIADLAKQKINLWEAYQTLKNNEKIKNEEEYKAALAKWKADTAKAIAEQDALYKTNSELLSSLKIAVYRANETQFRVQLTGSSQAAAMLEKYGKVTLTGTNVKIPANVTIAQLSEGILVDAEVPAGTGCGSSVAASLTAEFSGDMEMSAIYTFSKGNEPFQRQVILNKYKIHVSGNSTHGFSFGTTCPKEPEPSIGTTLEGPGKDPKLIDTAGMKDGDTVTLIDKVKFENLKGGQNYVIKGELVDGDGNSVGVTGVSDPFDPEASGGINNGKGYYSGTVNMAFQVPVKKIRENEKLVAYETLYKGTTPQSGNEVKEHKDKNDASQTVTEKPRIGTTAKVNGESLNDGKIARPAEGADVKITDTVVWHKLQPGTYTLSGKLMKKVGDQVSEVPGSATQKNFSVSGGKTGTVTMDLKLPSKQIDPGASYVVFEKVYKGGNNTSGEPVAKHEDQNDDGQTVSVSPKEHKLPTIKTVAWVRDDGKSLISSVEADGKDFIVKDKIEYKDLKVGTYTAFATLVNKDNPKEIIASGRQVFTNGTENGSTLVELAVDGSKVKADGKYVVFERIYQGEQTTEPSGEPYAKHQEINDQSQTITVAPKKAVPAEFKIVKKTEGDNANTDRVFDFDVACGGYKTTVAVVVRKGQTQGETKVSDSALTSGMSCQVSEQEVNDNLNTVKVKFSGTNTNSDRTVAKFNLTENNAKTVVVTATNTFTPKQAKFTVRKNVEAAEVTHFSVPNSFDFSYKCDGDAYWKTIPTLKAGETSAAINVKPGVKCEVKENSATPHNLNRTLTWDGADSQADGIATFRTDANNNVALVATNTYTEKTGQLEISKQVVDQTAGAGNIPGTFQMKYLCATGQKASSLTVPEGSVSVNKGGTATITGIPVGSQCAVYEDTTGINVPNTTLTTTFDGQAPKMVTLGGRTVHNAALSNPIQAGESQKATIKVENKYVNQKVGGFEVKKLVSGVVSPETVLKDVAFDFGYSCTIPGSSYPVKGNFKLKHGQTFSSADPTRPQLNNLPVGTECKVWEETPKSVENAD